MGGKEGEMRGGMEGMGRGKERQGDRLRNKSSCGERKGGKWFRWSGVVPGLCI